MLAKTKEFIYFVRHKMKVYFKNLDGIRFFAALFVLLQHSFGFRKEYTPGNSLVDPLFAHSGVLGVNLFFVLSGFLISYLLLVEKDTTSTVSYKNFYIRRILRIWPLYLGYGLVLTLIAPYVFGQLGMGNDITPAKILLNLVFLFLFSVNVQLAFWGTNSGVFEISWSVCVEEQFYLVWPILINNFRKKLLSLFLVLAAISLISRLFFYIYLPSYAGWTETRGYKVNYLLIFDKLDLFGGGLLIAYLFHNRVRLENTLKKIFHPLVQVIMIILTLLYTFSIIRPDDREVVLFTDHYFCIVLYGYVILSAVRDNSILKLESPLLNTLGRVSFGIYLFHTAVCQVVLALFKKFIRHPESHLLYDVIYPLCNLVLTCLIAYLSYNFFEKRFLRLKNKYAIVKTRI